MPNSAPVYADVRQRLNELADALCEQRGYFPASSFPVQRAVALEDLAFIARCAARRSIQQKVQRGGLTWTAVGKTLRISRQGARKRFG